MKRILCSLLLCLFVKFSFCQNVEIAEINGDPMIKISLSNLLKIVEMPFSEFNNLMAEYEYIYKSEYKSYLWGKGGVTAPLISVSKDAGKSSFYWSDETLGMVGDLKDELPKYFFDYDAAGNAVYRVLYNGKRYELTLRERSIRLLLQP